MKLKAVDHHTIDLDLLANGSLVLDVGAYGWSFSSFFAARGCTVYALDPSPDMIDPGIKGVTYVKKALVGEGQAKALDLLQVRDRDGWHLVTDRTPNDPKYQTVSVPTCTITEFMNAHSVLKWDAIKLNCEGAELDILRTWPGPIAKQICVSFHEHVWPEHHQEVDATLEHMAQWYDVVQHPYDERYSAGFNHWDTLLKLR